MSFSCDSDVCMGDDATAYLVVILKHCYDNSYHRYTIRSKNDTGCYTKTSSNNQLLLCQERSNKNTQILICDNGYSQSSGDKRIYSYTGSIGNQPVSTFSPADVCTDPDSNFLLIDSNDVTVDLLDKKETFLRIIMSTEDGLSGIKWVVTDRV